MEYETLVTMKDELVEDYNFSVNALRFIKITLENIKNNPLSEIQNSHLVMGKTREYLTNIAEMTTGINCDCIRDIIATMKTDATEF